MVGKDYRCMKYKNRVCDVVHMCHVLVWDQNACDNAYLTHVHHVVFVEPSPVYSVLYQFPEENTIRTTIYDQ